MKRTLLAVATASVLFWQPAGAQSPEALADKKEMPSEAGLPDPVGLVMARHMAGSDCEDPQSEHMAAHPGITTEIGATYVLYAVPCSESGGRVTYRLYAHETGEIGGITTLYFAGFSENHGWIGTDLLTDIAVDGPKLAAFLPASDDSACGYGEWLFEDHAYRMVRYARAGTCGQRPLENWVTIFPDE